MQRSADRAIASYGLTEQQTERKTKQKEAAGKNVEKKKKMQWKKKKEKRLRPERLRLKWKLQLQRRMMRRGSEEGVENCLQSGGCAHMGRASVWLT